MKKKALIVTVLAMLIAVPAVFAATNDQKNNELYSQMTQMHQQMTRQAVDNGTITSEEAAQMDEHMREIAPIMEKMMGNGEIMWNMMQNMMQNGGMMGDFDSI